MRYFKRALLTILLTILATVILSKTPLFASSLPPEESDFIKEHPRIPNENHACTLGNYYPKNKSQKEALKWTLRVIDLPPDTGAGLWLWGPVGVGKSHLAVGIAKELSDQGKKVFFYQGGTGDYLSRIDESQYDVFVLDDMNSFYVCGDGFRKITLECFNRGKHLFVTSNTPYKELLPQAFAGCSAEMPRFEDRVKNMIKILHIEGVSQRSDASWMDFPKMKTLLRWLKRKNNKVTSMGIMNKSGF